MKDNRTGDDIMYILIGGDIRPNVINGLEFLVERLKVNVLLKLKSWNKGFYHPV